ncbi:Dirigent protein [Quillaja saponaria]|uniref:Dirigent protein n=1 Tax=Quillaja saponaria TaxID=32244 RepID=A0AAD7VHD2_QUISA|nr:Dirigent protein [Quillaja saponaria]
MKLTMEIMIKLIPSIHSIAFNILFLLVTTFHHSSSARTLSNPTTITHNYNHSHNHHRITFFMQNVLNNSQLPLKPTTTKIIGPQIPFPKPLGFFPPTRGIPLPQSSINPTIPATTQTLDLSNIGLSFPTSQIPLEELEFGMVTSVEEELFDGSRNIVGKAEGVYVASSENGSSHMMAITASFVKDEYKNGLKFFGVHRTDALESHVAVIGGTGRYHGANGYASIKAVDAGGSNNTVEERNRA